MTAEGRREAAGIAIVGLACRVPGAEDPHALWRLLGDGASAIGHAPSGRWDPEQLDDAAAMSAGIRYGGFLKDVDAFDSAFFGISPREAAAMDPQQRLMLELCWEACEEAQVVPGRLRGSQTGVFVGSISSDYAEMLGAEAQGAVGRHLAAGLHRSMIANRVSYTLGLRGASLTIDTGQSASLVAVHMACESLRQGECGLALAGGVHLNLSSAAMLRAASFGGLSPDGRCAALDARANGYVRGEGGAVVLLKRLPDALAAGDRIHCVIRSSAVNNDGGGDGLTAPSQTAQEEVLRAAYRRAAVKRAAVQYVELHGTGTILGDRVEASALGAVLGRAKPAERPLAVGSVKTNIGHLEGAAGIVGLLKAALCVERGEIPASLHFERERPDIPLERLRLRVQQELAPWPAQEGPRMAGVSSFGLGGTNCHVVLTERPSPVGASPASPRAAKRQRAHSSAADTDRSPALRQTDPVPALGKGALAWVLSARSAPALCAQAQRLKEHLEHNPDLQADAVGHALFTTRTAFEHRAVVLGKDRDELLGGLQALACGQSSAGVVQGSVAQTDRRDAVLVFPGQGSQWQGMALALMEASPLFAERMLACERALSKCVDWSLTEVLRGGPGAPSLERVEVVQPALFAVMVCLAQLWHACGVRAGAVVGHSQGEAAAAYIAGALSLEDAARVVAVRSKLGAEVLVGHGGMAWIELPAREVQVLCERWPDRVSVAAVNAPSSTVVSGEPGAISELTGECAAAGARVRKIPAAAAAGHSPQVELIREQLVSSLADVRPSEGELPFYSAVIAERLDHGRLDAGYWYRNAREPVNFEAAIRALLADGHRAFVEVSPHPVLTAAMHQTVEAVMQEAGGGEEVLIAASLRRDDGGRARFLRSLAKLWVTGLEVDWEHTLGSVPGPPVALPTYPFQRESHWLPGRVSDARIDGASGATVGEGSQPAAEGGSGPTVGEGSYATPGPPSAEPAAAARLHELPLVRARSLVLDLILRELAAELGYSSPHELPPKRTFKELGVDSPAAVELRNRLGARLGVSLPATLVFDKPTPEILARHLVAHLRGEAAAGDADLLSNAAARRAPAAHAEPIAIVAMACRYPGGVRSPEDLWELVAGGGDAICGFPTNRGWNLPALYHPDPDHPGTSYVREGGFLEDADRFDAAFFGISPREALAIDPQQRLLLEVCWEALERARIVPESLHGAQTGVFIGAMNNDYGPRAGGSAPADLEGYLGIGSTTSVASGRIAYTFGLEGPAMTIDTACSSSLVALHLACAALRAGECEQALAGGVTVLATPRAFVEFSRQRALAPDGRVKPYAEGADGTAWSEGAGVLLLEPLSDARRRGHPVLATVRASAVNQDGASNGLTAPNGSSQRRVIEQALANAALSSADVDMVEGHGTGTRLGDPIEVQALLATYGQRPAESPLWLGSIKSNIGHAQSAAGVAGVINMVMAMRHGVMPGTLNAERPSSQVDWSQGAVSLLTAARPWPDAGRPRRAGVSSFGVSGTNAHVILEQPVAPADEPGAEPPSEPHRRQPAAPEGEPPLGPMWVLSARSQTALRAQAERLQAHVTHDSGLDARSVAHVLARRPAHERRAAVMGGSSERLLAGLRAVADGQRSSDVTVGGALGGAAQPAFVFPGQGAQWSGMAVDLLDGSHVFAEQVALCEQALSPHVDWRLRDVMLGAPGAPGLDRVDVVQPVLFAIMVALAGMWRACGVRPTAVVGHSQGEIAAAHVAGGLSLEDAAQVVAVRSRALRELAGLGGMVSASLGQEEMGSLIGRLEHPLSLAAINGPRASVVSGEPDALEELLSACHASGVRARRIPVDYAAHSSQVEAIQDRLIRGCRGISPRSGEVPFYSATTGELLDTAQLDHRYWYRNLRETVRFQDAVQALLGDRCRAFIEVSPHPVLMAGVQETIETQLGDGAGGQTICSLRREQDGLECFLRALAQAWTIGVDVDWATLLGEPSGEPPELPTYAFQGERYWLHGADGGDPIALGQAAGGHPLLGAMVAPAGAEGWLFTGRLSLQAQPWLGEHSVMGSTLLPAGALLDLALHAGRACGCELVRELTLETPLLLEDEGALELQVHVGAPDGSGQRPLAIYSRRAESADDASERDWTRHASGTLSAGTESEDAQDAMVPLSAVSGAEIDADAWPAPGAQPVELSGLYERMSQQGVDYGPALRVVQAAWRRGDEMFAELELSEQGSAHAAGFCLHPALLAGALQPLAIALDGERGIEGGAGSGGERGMEGEPGGGGGREAATGTVRMPFSFGGVALHAAGVRSLRARLRVEDAGRLSMTLFDHAGAPVAEIASLTTREVSVEQLAQARRAGGDAPLRIEWAVLSAVEIEPTPDSRPWALVADERSCVVKRLGGATVAQLNRYTDLRALGEALDAGGALPGTVLLDIGERARRCSQAAFPQAAGELAHEMLDVLQVWLADERLRDAQLVVLSRRAVPVLDEEHAAPICASAGVCGMVRSAQSEHPGCFVLVDIDDEQSSWHALPAALAAAAATGETELALREGRVLVPRLTRIGASARPAQRSFAASEPAPQSCAFALDPDRSVLITGGTTGLGAVLARHLVRKHGVRSLVLASRRGGGAPGASELQRELHALGAQVTLAACDVSDREQLAELIHARAHDQELGAVVHAAGVADDGVLMSLTHAQLDAALAPKLHAAWHLHELTADMDLSAFVLFSSVAGTLGAPGMANYAAANACLDALAAHRRSLGLPGVSLAWGVWDGETGMGSRLSRGDIARFGRGGVRGLPQHDALELFDAACAAGQEHLVLARLDRAALRAQAQAGTVPALLRGLIRIPAHGVQASHSLARRLAQAGASERAAIVTRAVLAEVVDVLGHASTAQIDPESPFRDLGFDSLTAVELRNRLRAATGVQLPVTAVFDHPSVAALSAHLLAELSAAGPGPQHRGRRPAAGGEQIAIVGMGCRFPGGVCSPDDLWQLLERGDDAISAFPRDRGWGLEGLDDREGERAGRGGFLDDVASFDAAFFGIGPREALAMDPQQRLLLEVCWEALEKAGLDPRGLRGSPTGVFAGISIQDYLQLGQGAPSELEGYRVTGGSAAVLSGRVAYTLGLQGPAMTIDTACSSSLVSAHLACRSLRQGECSLALAGGVTALSTPELFVEFARQGGLAADGRCKAFSDDADGTSLAEGVGVLVLERLSDAQRNGRNVLAVVRGSAVNQDGASNGLTAPNGVAQQRVIQRALEDAGLCPADVDAVEGHGTGTSLGDPIEAHALLAAYGQDRPQGRPLWLGSVKSNIGHTQAAAGVAGVIKMTMALQRETLPSTLHVARPSTQIDWDEDAVALLTASTAWPAGACPRRAGVSSFGISGTNAHLILEDAPPSPPVPPQNGDGGDSHAGAPESGGEGPHRARDAVSSGRVPGAVAWVVSGANDAALREQARRLRAHTELDTGASPLDIGLSLAARPQLSHRAVALGGDRESLLAGLEQIERGASPAGVPGGVAQGAGLAFVFAGQGAQYAGMGAALYEQLPAFKRALEEVCAPLDAALGCSLRELVFSAEGSPGAERLDRTEITQAAVFALEVALFRLLDGWGVRPDHVIGHSVGELAAAHVAGALSLQDACALVAARGRLMGELPAGGAMVAVQASEREIAQSLSELAGAACLAAVNGPESVVVSGEQDAVLQLAADWSARGRKTTRLRVSHAFHSHRMDGMLEPFAKVAAGISFQRPAIPLVCNVTGCEIDAEQLCSPDYWVRQVREPVRFADGVKWLAERGTGTFLELGPGGLLSAMVHECLPDGGVALPVLRRGHDEPKTLLSTLAGAWVNGAAVRWPRLFDGTGARRVELPTYAFQRERYWSDAAAGKAGVASAGQRPLAHPLLGAAVALAGDGGWLLTGRVSLAQHPWLADHLVLGSAVLPGTALLELAAHAGAQAGCGEIRELTLHAPLVLDEDAAAQLQVRVGEQDSSGCRPVSIHSRLGADPEQPQTQADWICHASGSLAPQDSAGGASESAPAELFGAWPPAAAEQVAIREIHDALAGAGLQYGPAFAGLGAVWRRAGQIFLEAELPDGHHGLAESFGLHPALLDCALQALAAGLADGDVGVAEGDRSVAGGDAGIADGDGGVAGRSKNGDRGGALLPFSFADVKLALHGAHSLRACISLGEGHTASVVACDEQGRQIASIGSLAIRRTPREQLRSAHGPHQTSLFELTWVAHQAAGDGAANVTLSNVTPLSIDCASHDARATPAAVHAAARDLLARLQQLLTGDELSRPPLVVLTRGAVACEPGEDIPDLGGAALWGMVRSAQAEHPGRLVLLDLDGPPSQEKIAAALATGEPQLAIRRGAVMVPRLVRARSSAGAGQAAPAFAPQDTVLITGGAGALGAAIARHLVLAGGARQLLLASRQGSQSSRARALAGELTALGATVTLARCDVSDRAQLERLLGAIAAEHPLRAVVHAAGLLDDGTVQSLTPERLDAVLAPKVDAAWHLHELTRELDLREFIVFSSAAGVLGSAGQASYAAANSFLDALVAHRRALGLPAVSLAWGSWSEEQGMAGRLGQAARARLARLGVAPLSADEGLGLFDAARQTQAAPAVAVRLDWRALRRQADEATLLPLLSGLVRGSARRPPEQLGGSLAQRLAGMAEDEREAVVLELVCEQAARVLGHSSSREVTPSLAFKELGFDSLAAVELRNGLAATSGLRLAATLVFDHPTPLAVARHMLERLTGAGQAPVRVRAATPAGADDPIALVGMSCRYPGGVASPEQLWELVARGGDAVGSFPEDRGWDVERLYHPDPDHHGTSYAREGGFLYDAGDFDAGFFGIGPREATAMDPQQRLLLELCWEAFERAEIPPQSLRGSDAGVFMGVMYHDYASRLLGSGRGDLEAYMGTGSAGSVASGRVAYTFGLEGPAVTLDTACSSSLVTLHMACGALRSRECSLALAGGVTVMSTPATFLEFSRQRGMAPDGRCKSFADGADGVGWSEGVGVLVLERLSDALRNGREVLAIVRGSAVNQDGASNGLTAPNGPAQQRVILQALANAGLSPAEVDAVEGHGTGTTLGDPIEAQALLATYGQSRPQGAPLWLGSIKSNIGHSQAAAGVAGVIKMAMALRNGLLPRTLHVDRPSTHVDWDAGAVTLLTEDVPWPREDRPRRAAVSSFGVSGTNAHVILEEAPSPHPAAASSAPDSHDEPGTTAWVVSARSEQALRSQAARLKEFALAKPRLPAGDMSWSLARRPAFEHRAVVLGGDLDDLIGGLSRLSAGERDGLGPQVVLGAGAAGGGMALLFTGQGSQRVGAGAELHRMLPPFRDALDEVCEHLDPLMGCSLQAVMFGPAAGDERHAAGLAGGVSGGAALAEGLPSLDHTSFAQAALFALEVAMFRLLEGWGVRPQFLIGHSIGEVAAAHVAGVLSLQDACTFVAARGRLMGALAQAGAMVAVQASEEEALAALGGHEGRVALAAVNGPRSVVLSGDEQAVLDVAEHWRRLGRKTSRLRVSHAFHSPHIDEMLHDLGLVAAGLSFHAPRIPLVCNLTGRGVEAEQIGTPDYWVRHARETVRFGDGIRWLGERGVSTFLEIGPGGALSAMAGECVSPDCATLALLRRGRPEIETLSSGLAGAWTRGHDVDWGAVVATPAAKRVELPTYGFQRRRYWVDAPAVGSGDPAALGQAAAHHPLLGSAVALPDGKGSLFTGRVSSEGHPWIAEHIVMGRALLPASAFAELALHAGGQLGCESLERLELHAPLVLPDGAAVQLQVLVGEPDESAQRTLAIYSRPQSLADVSPMEPDWTRHASGTLSAPAAEPPLAALSEPWPGEGAVEVGVQDLYDDLRARGLEYGAAFRNVRRAWRLGADVVAEVLLEESEGEQAHAFGVHPALLDAMLHCSAPLATDAEGETCRLPVSLSALRLYAHGARSLRVRLSPSGHGSFALRAWDEQGTPVLEIGSLATQPVTAEQLFGAPAANTLFGLDWIGVIPREGTLARYERWAVLGPAEGSPAAASIAHAVDAGAAMYQSLDALVAAVSAGDSPPQVVLAPVPLAGAGERPAGLAAHECAHWALDVIQRWLAEESLADSRLALITCGATAVEERDGVVGLAAAPVWGLARTAQSEHPGRIVLVDLDDKGSNEGAEMLAHAIAGDEPQLAIRGGRLFAPRLKRASGADAEAVQIADGERTVLITGGTGTLGSLLARHLVERHGVRSLVLASRQGADAEGVESLCGELSQLGAHVTVSRCDVSDRTQVQALLQSLPPERPLGAVVHAAGALDDGVVSSLTAERLSSVLRPKLDGAVHLHELTQELELSAFVLFSSSSSTLGAAGQGNYAAANAFLDALAAHRRARGLPGLALGWGPWEADGGMVGTLGATDRARMLRNGIRPLSGEQGLDLFDASLACARALVLPIAFELPTLRARSAEQAIPPLLHELLGAPRRRAGGARPASLARRLADTAAPAREGLVLGIARAHTAAVLGHTSAGDVDPGLTFKDLGFDSLAAVELRNRLSAEAGFALPATLVFDHPTPSAVAAYLLAQAQPVTVDGGASLESELLALEQGLARTELSDGATRAAIATRLQALARSLQETEENRGAVCDDDEDLRSAATAEEVLELIGRELDEETHALGQSGGGRG